MVNFQCEYDRIRVRFKLSTVVADDFEYVIHFTDNVIPPEINPTIPSENNPCLNLESEREHKSCNLEKS